MGGLIDRDVELGALQGVVESAARGSGECICVVADPGAGKSSLLRAVKALAAARDVRPLWAAATPAETAYPFGLVQQLFGPVVAEASREVRAQWFADAAAPASGVFDASYELQAGADDAVAFRVLNALYWLAGSIAASTPSVLIVDDLQWADPPSARFLSFFARRLDGMGMSLIVAARDGSTDTLAGLEPSSVLRLPALSDAATEILVERWLGEPEPAFLDAVHTVTGGSPLFVTELVRELRARNIRPTAQAISTVNEASGKAIGPYLASRVTRVSQDAQRVAFAACVYGAQAPIGDLRRVVELELPALSSAIEELRAEGLLASDDPVAFLHPVIRDALEIQIPAPLRAQLHRRVAGALHARHAPVEAVAAHLLDATVGSEPWVCQVLVTAAKRATTVGAPDAASAFLSRALAEDAPDRDDAMLLALLGAAERDAGLPHAAEHLQRATEIADDRLEVLLPASAALAELLFYGDGETPRAIGVLDAARSAIPPGETAALELVDGARLMLTCFAQAQDYPQGRDVLSAAEPQTRAASTGQRLIAGVMSFRSALQNDVVRARELALDALGEGMLLAEIGPATAQLYLPIHALIFNWETELANDVLAQTERAARRCGSRLAYHYVMSIQAWLALRTGHVAQAETAARESLRVSIDAASIERAFAVATLVEALAHRDRVDEALELAATVEVDALQPTPHTMAFLGCRSQARRIQRDHVAELADLVRAETLLRSSNMSDPHAVALPDVLPWQANRVYALLANDQPGQATALADDLLRRAESASDRRVALGLAQRAAAATRKGDDAIDLLQRAVSTLSDTPALLDLASATCDLGAALRRQRHRRDAREHLRRAADLAHELGATRLLNTASDELAASGQRLRSRSSYPGTELTPAERRVATLAIEGMTNREIAQALFLTIKTVETHLSHIYQKLDITSRRQLSKAIAPAAEAL
ncbi:hypothetical protein AYO39_01380 [Actinobacteria bacterium SCGC AG-212-D09]|nr:hypothetical protein AYO39_01380 [Actinobacteria bacterium SCGC AG-212-D09]